MIAVTGSSGFIGRAVVACINNEPVVRIDRSDGNDILTCDIVELLAGCRAVIHLAGVLGTAELFDDVEQAVDVNIHGTLRVLRACDKTGTPFVGITMPDCWPSVYQATKLAAVRLAHAFHNATNLKVMHLRAFNVYGLGQAYGEGHPRKIVPTFAAESWRGQPMQIWGDGEQLVDLVSLEHVAACLADATSLINGHPLADTFDLGTGKPMTVNEVARMVGNITGNHSREYLPMRIGEVPGTRICATNPGPFDFDDFDDEQFRTVVESYQ